MRRAHQLWQRVCIADLCSTIVDCVNRTAPTAPGQTEYKMIRTTNVKSGWIDLRDVKYVTEETYRRWTRRQLPRRGDVVLTREAPLGEVGIIRTDDKVFLGQRLVAYRANSDRLDPRFLLYAFQSSDLLAQVAAFGSGSTVEHMRVPDAKRLSVLIPPLPTQRRIADILSAYDDLIENNTRRIAILEEMARRLYEEWFVEFRVPRERCLASQPASVKPALPLDWKRKPLSSITSLITRGIAPRYDEDAGGVVINQKCIRGGRLSLAAARRQRKVCPPEKLVRVGDVLINSTGVGTLGRVAQALSELGDCTVDTHVTIVRPKAEIDPTFFGLCLLQLEGYFVSQGVGSTGQTELGRTRIGETMVLVPPHAIQIEFGRLVAPLRTLSANLEAQRSRLRAARDLLLPKLISGEIDVSAAPTADHISRNAEAA